MEVSYYIVKLLIGLVIAADTERVAEKKTTRIAPVVF